MDKKPPKKDKKPVNPMKYAGLAFQLGITIAIGAFIGQKLDAWAQFDRPYLTLVCLLFFAAAGFYTALRDLL